MYIEKISITSLRVFAEAEATFQFPGRNEDAGRKLECPNVNLILGNNGAGKSSVLKAIGLTLLGPLAAKFSPYMLVRQRAQKAPRTTGARRESIRILHAKASIRSRLRLTWQDLEKKKPDAITNTISWETGIVRKGDEESILLKSRLDKFWLPINIHSNAAFFAVGYGATRRVDTDPGSATTAQKMRNIPLRQQRVQSLFSDGYTLVPLGHWLPELALKNHGRHKQVCQLINTLLPDNIEFTGKQDESSEFVFEQRGARVPFAALSDGCRAFIGWVADMLYHLCFGCPSGVKLVDNCGVVLVDEIDLHLHPEWQRIVLPKLAKTFPNLQFIVTSHSPIVVGTLQRENIWVSETAPSGEGSVLVQKPGGVHGLSADQILLTEYFGLETSRAPKKQARLKRIAAAAERKVPDQATAFLRSLVTSMETEAMPAAPMKTIIKFTSQAKEKLEAFLPSEATLAPSAAILMKTIEKLEALFSQETLAPSTTAVKAIEKSASQALAKLETLFPSKETDAPPAAPMKTARKTSPQAKAK